MEKEIRKNLDKFGNYESNLYPCPRCSSEFLTYVMQFDSNMCEQCDWFDGWAEGDPKEQIDYDNPQRERLINGV
jgi:hypothetical protein